MLFTFKTLPSGFEYNTTDEDVFGSITFRSKVELVPEECDDIVSTLLKDTSGAELVKGELILPREAGTVSIDYEFKKKPQWELVTTNTKANEQEKSGHLQRLLKNLVSAPQRTTSSLVKFVVAFREAYKRLGD